MGVEIVAFPQITKPERNIQKINVAGRSGSLILDSGTYNDYTLNIECVLNPFSNKKQPISKIINWLDGAGDLILSIEPNMQYKAFISNAIPLTNVIDIFPNFQVIFNVQPFKKALGINSFEITKDTNYNNPCFLHTHPIITIYGTGDVQLNINGEVFLINSIDEYITINSDLQEVYKDDINQNNNYNNFNFPKLQPGLNNISFTGDVEKIVIEPNLIYI